MEEDTRAGPERKGKESRCSGWRRSVARASFAALVLWRTGSCLLRARRRRACAMEPAPSAFRAGPDFCPECGTVLPLPGVQDRVTCVCCDFAIAVRGGPGPGLLGPFPQPVSCPPPPPTPQLFNDLSPLQTLKAAWCSHPWSFTGPGPRLCRRGAMGRR